MSEARDRGGREVIASGEDAVELRAHGGSGEARDRGGREVIASGEDAVELRAHQEHGEARNRGGREVIASGEDAVELRAHQEHGEARDRGDATSDYVLGLADDALISAQRLGWWISRAPQLEEDLALANIGLDQLGQARTLLAHAGELEGRGRGEDDLAYFRDERAFRNVWLVERPQTDFGVAMARLLIFASWQSELYAALRGSADATLAGVAGKAVKEVAYHLDHAAHWVVRLGDGTEESHQRMQQALEAEWPYLDELFGPIDAGLVESGVAVDPTALRDSVVLKIEDVLAQATLTVPQVPPALGGGRRGLHTEELGYLLAEMQHLSRSHPGVTW